MIFFKSKKRNIPKLYCPPTKVLLVFDLSIPMPAFPTLVLRPNVDDCNPTAVQVNYHVNENSGFHPLPEHLRKIFTSELLSRYVMFHNMMYATTENIRQPTLKFFAASKAFEKLVIEAYLVHSFPTDMIHVKCRLFDPQVDNLIVKKVVRLSDSQSNHRRRSFVKKFRSYEVSFLMSKPGDDWNTRSFIDLGALGPKFDKVFASKSNRKIEIIDNSNEFTFEPLP